jgi:hypothetical protein
MTASRQTRALQLNPKLNLLVLAALCFSSTHVAAQEATFKEVLSRTSTQVTAFLGQFSQVACTEHVTQLKFGKENKIESRAESSYDYLVILDNTGGNLTLDESRLPIRSSASQKKATKNQTKPLLISNGFTMLFLIFHPLYSAGFRFDWDGEEVIDGRRLAKIRFEQVHNTRALAALSVRGREYPLALSGTAWIDPQTAMISRISAAVENGTEDIGMKSLRVEVEYAPVAFQGDGAAYWYPAEAQVDVETPRQHWRNIHRFTDYKQFSVNTQQQVADVKP